MPGRRLRTASARFPTRSRCAGAPRRHSRCGGMAAWAPARLRGSRDHRSGVRVAREASRDRHDHPVTHGRSSSNDWFRVFRTSASGSCSPKLSVCSGAPRISICSAMPRRCSWPGRRRNVRASGSGSRSGGTSAGSAWAITGRRNSCGSNRPDLCIESYNRPTCALRVCLGRNGAPQGLVAARYIRHPTCGRR